MITYKDYQNKVLKSVDSFIGYLVKYNKPTLAWAEYFASRTSEETGIKDVIGYKNYIRSPKTPFTCIRVPTGGGKTILACETVVKTQLQYLNRQGGLVIWFVPTEAIYTQTLEKLKDPNDAHRQVLLRNFTNVNIFSKSDALKSLRPHHMQNGSLSIIVSIIDSFTMGKKVFEDAIDGYEQFNDSVEQNQQILLENTTIENHDQKVGKVSLFNIIRIYNPQVIVDEGHLHGSELIQSTIADLNPSIIWEFTATPKNFSNILHRTSPIELKIEDMIKLPIQIRHEPSWQDVISKAVKLQKELESKSRQEEKETGRYVRPIVLIRPDQITQREGKITPTEIKKYLKDNYPQLTTKEGDSENYQVAERYSEGKSQDIDDKKAKKGRVDTLGDVKKLFDKKSNIRYVIAFNAIREGWDCSFAYIYANLSNIKSETDAEQFLGRILRMPGGQKMVNEDLNKSYVISVARTTDRTELASSVESIVKILTNSGFDRSEAVKSIQDNEKDPSNLPYISKRQVQVKKVSLPQFYVKTGKINERLSIAQHLLKEFNIDNVKLAHDLELIKTTSSIAEVDMDETEKWQPTFLDNELSLGLFELSSSDLVSFILKQTREQYFSREIEQKVISGWIAGLLNKYSLQEIKRHLAYLCDYYKMQKKEAKLKYQKESFDRLVAENKLTIISDMVQDFPETQEIYYDSGNYSKSVYDRCENLNKDEKNIAQEINDSLGSKDWFYRNREMKDFYIQCWWGRFYPDFIALKDGKILILEVKGREDDLDKEKRRLGELISQLDNAIQFEWRNV